MIPRVIVLSRSASFSRRFTCCQPLLRWRTSRFRCLKAAFPIQSGRDRAVTLLESVGLEHRLNHFPAKLSGGERQRVAIARSLANSPSVLLADEPTGNLDSENARLILELIIRLHREQNMTLVLVTHDMSIARRASRTIQMKDGRIVSDRESTNAEA